MLFILDAAGKEQLVDILSSGEKSDVVHRYRCQPLASAQFDPDAAGYPAACIHREPAVLFGKYEQGRTWFLCDPYRASLFITCFSSNI